MEIEFIFQIVILIFSVVIHEVSHGYAARAQGDLTAEYEGRLSLNPARHLDPWGSLVVPFLAYMLGGFIIGWAKPVPVNTYNFRNARWGEAIVAFAGPLSNILIAAVFSALMRFGGYEVGSPVFQILAMIVFINIILAVFNLVPVAPLDGSKILFSLFPNSQSLRFFMERYALIFLLVFIFFLWEFILPIAFSLFELLTGFPLGV